MKTSEYLWIAAAVVVGLMAGAYVAGMKQANSPA